MFLVVKQEFRNLTCFKMQVFVVFVDTASCFLLLYFYFLLSTCFVAQRRIERGAINDETTTIKRANKEYRLVD